MNTLQKIILPLAAAFALTGCHTAIMSDLSECPQYTVFTFDVKAPGAISFPEAVDELRVFAFDEQGRLIGEWVDGAVVFLPGYEMKTNYYRAGTTTFVAWGGYNLADYDFSAFVAGATLDDLILLMQQQEAGKLAADASPLFVGVATEPLTQAAGREGRGSVTDSVHFHLTQITNHIDLEITGLETGHEYTITFTAKNNNYRYDGELLGSDRFEWVPDDFLQTDEAGGTTLTVSYDILRFVPGAPGDYLIEVRDENGVVVYSFDPLHDFILHNQDDNPFRDHLDLNHDFDIYINLREDETPSPGEETYMAVQVTISGWNLVFRNQAL